MLRTIPFRRGKINSGLVGLERYFEQGMLRTQIVLCLAAALGCASPGNSGRVNGTKSFTSDDGTKVAYRMYGAGPTVVLIHGLTGAKEDLAPLAEKLASVDFRAVVIDVRGHGESDKPHTADSYGEQLLTDIRDLLDHLSIKSAHIVGYSMGGDIANKFREVFPNRVRSCVVGGAGLGVSQGWADSPHDFAQIADSLANGDGWIPLLRQPGAITPGLASEDEIAATNKMMSAGQDNDALSALCRRYETLEINRQRSAGNTVRTLIVVGSKDAEHASAIELSAVLANSRLHVIEGANHFEAWTHKEFGDAVTAFLRDNERAK